MDRFVDELSVHLKKLDYQTRVVSISNLHLLQKEIVGFRDQGLFDDEFYEQRLGFFRFQPPDALPQARSVIVIAVPRPQTRATFTWNGHARPLVIPPTYTAYDRTRENVEKIVAEILSEKEHRLARTALPLKLLAAQSGLGQYGRNNVCYVSGMGSFLQLVAMYSDMPCEEDAWQEATMMKSCQECDLCRLACPTGAIPSDRFLLRAERCVSYHNEKKTDVPFPNWLDSTWHNCVVGCMRCQNACPENRQFTQWIGEEEKFSEEETSLLLEGVTRDKLPIETLRKLERLSLTDYLDSLPRNLSVFFKQA
jgi:epoxyqueuosine reductase